MEKRAAGGPGPWQVAAYIRLSREDGGEAGGSVKNQRERILAYLAAWGEDYRLAGIYIDDGCTGTDTNRESFQRMLRDIREHRVNCVIVKDLSRLSRNLADATHHLEHLFVEYDVRFISLELPALDSHKHPEQMNSILVPIQNVINDDFCRQTSLKVRGVFNTKRRQGQFIGAFAPYGYQKDPADRHRLVADEEAARVVRDIFAWYVNGLSKNAIAKKLNKLGEPNPAAYKKRLGLRYKNPNTAANDGLWGPKTVAGILQNQVYLGHMVQGRCRVKSYKVHTQTATPREEWFVVENTHEPIVDRELFDHAQQMDARHARAPSGARTAYPLSGFVRCPDCQKAMVRSQGGGRAKYAYYQCRTYRDKSRAACTKHSIRADVLEDVVLQALKAQMSLISDPGGIADALGEAARTGEEIRRLEALLAARERELAQKTVLKDALYEDWKNGDLTREDYRRLKEKYEQQAESLALSIDGLKARQQAEDGGNVRLEAFLRFGREGRLTRGLAAALVDIVYVHEDGAVDLVLNYRDPYGAKGGGPA